MAGAGTIGVGGAGSGVGVGGWQLYEHVINPTLDTQLSKENLTLKPVRVPLSEQVQTGNNKFNFNSWDCVSKLFLNLKNSIKHTDSTATTYQPQQVGTLELWDFSRQNNDYKVQVPLYLNKPTATNNLVACGLFDWRGGSDASKDKIYFKSEVAVKDENHGWVMWNGLSSDPSSNPNKVDFEYRLLTFRKEGGVWKIDRGFAWKAPTSSGNSNDRLKVDIPRGHSWKEVNNHAGEGYSKRQIWSGIAKVDKSSDQHLIKSLKVYTTTEGSQSSEDRYKAEFFGMDGGKWSAVENETKGYESSNKIYVDGQGWQTISTAINLRNSLNEWYSPFINKKIRWMTCGQWSGERKSFSSMTLADGEIKGLCYGAKTTQKSQ